MIHYLPSKNSLGVALILLGLPFSWILRDSVGLYNSQLFSLFFLGISLFLIPDKKSLIKLLRANKITLFKFTPLFFLVPSTIAAFLSTPLDINGLAYMVFTVGFLIALNTLSNDKAADFPSSFILIGSLTSLSIVLFLISTGYAFEGRRLVIGETNSPGFIGYVSAIAFSSSLFFLFSPYKRNTVLSLLAKVNLFICPLILLASLSRSQYIGISLSVSFLILRRFLPFVFLDQRHSRDDIRSYKTLFGDDFKGNLKKEETSFLWIKFLILGAIFLMLSLLYDELAKPILDALIPNLSDYFQRLGDMLQGGYNTFSGTSSEDTSALIRYNNIQYALSNLTESGHGYKSLWIDCPILQSYYDGGILGFLTFSTISIFIPLYLIFKTLTSIKPATIHIFASCIYLTFSPILFLHGHPYAYFPWINISLFYFFFSTKPSEQRRKMIELSSKS